MKRSSISIGLLLVLALCAVSPGIAAENGAFKAEELDQMLAPVALYPDSLLAQVLMASTYPADVVEAASWSEANPNQDGDDAVKAVESYSWDPSVKSLVAFPQVLATMNQDPDWVQRVGDAFLAQPDDVMDSVQRLRAAAKEAGNLESNEQQNVTVQEAPASQDGVAQGSSTTQNVVVQGAPPPKETVIVIEPAQPEVIYVPTYNPTVVYGSWWYPSYPPVYLPPPPGYVFGTALLSGIAFGVGVGITNALWGDCDWGRRSVDIDVNRYNNININKKIDVNRKNVEWNHNSNNRRGVPYRDAKSRERYGKKVAGSESRREFRGRESARDSDRRQAEAALQKRGMDPGQGRKALRDDPQVRAAARDVDRDKTASAKGKIDREKVGGRAKTSKSRDTSTAARSRVSDNAFKGVSNPSRTKKHINRGNSSMKKMERHGGGGGRARTGGVPRRGRAR